MCSRDSNFKGPSPVHHSINRIHFLCILIPNQKNNQIAILHGFTYIVYLSKRHSLCKFCCLQLHEILYVKKSYLTLDNSWDQLYAIWRIDFLSIYLFQVSSTESNLTIIVVMYLSNFCLKMLFVWKTFFPLKKWDTQRKKEGILSLPWKNYKIAIFIFVFLFFLLILFVKHVFKSVRRFFESMLEIFFTFLTVI